jgi:hypothetical protein
VKSLAWIEADERAREAASPTITLASVRRLAQTAATLLDSRHGDPFKNSDWMRERQLALYLLALIDRLEAASAPMEKQR